MASQVFSGTANFTYTNNVVPPQNVRIVINYMASTPFVAAVAAVTNANGTIRTPAKPLVPAVLTLNWAGVSVSNISRVENLIIGRNLAYTQLYRDTAMGGTTSVFVGLQRTPEGDVARDSDGDANEIYQAVGVNNSVALAAVASNAQGMGITLPTELMLSPGQTFSAVCGIHNIVIIPENG